MSEQRVIERLAPLMSEARLQRIEEVLARRLRAVVAVMDNLHDPQNLSAITRSCEAFGVEELHAIEATERAKLRRRVTQGCQKWITLHRHSSSAACLDTLKARGYAIFGADARPDAVPLARLPVERPIALVFGAEHAGLRDETRARLDGYFIIPMAGFTQALNASAAAAISLYETTQRWRAVHGREGDLSDEEKLALRARFYRDSVRGARLVLALSGDPGALAHERQRKLWFKRGE